MREPRLAIALRHAAEGRLRIERQEQLIATLERDNRQELLWEARKFLLQMRQIQESFEGDVDRLERAGGSTTR